MDRSSQIQGTLVEFDYTLTFFDYRVGIGVNHMLELPRAVHCSQWNSKIEKSSLGERMAVY